jgi:putative ABC transport system ATP-binding protein
MPITIENLLKRYSAAAPPVLNVPELHIADGEQVAIVGKSGGGKSTLLNIIAGIVTATSGSCVVNETDVTKLSEAKRDLFRAENIGYVFQTFNLIQGLTALENVMLAMSFTGKVKEPHKRAKEVLQLIGLEAKHHSKPRELSVGEQQRVAIARAIANQPHILLADEPTANLDEANTDAVIKLLRGVASEEQRILVLVTHERDIAESFPRQINLKTLNKN